MLFLEASLVLLAPESTLSVCLFLCVAGEAAIIESSLIFFILFFIFYLLLKVNKHINFDAIYIQKAVVVEIFFFSF